MIWLLRHGDAEPGNPDFERRLTAKGERQSRAAGKALGRLGVRPDVCLTSPRVRARDTARLACEELGGVRLEQTGELGGGDFDPLRVAAGRGEVLLVGHEPDFSRAIAAATSARVKISKGGLAAIDEHLLHALYRPEDLAAIAG